MRLPKELIERKLSAALNARVAIDTLDVSPFAGSLDLSGITATAHDSSQPVLMVRRVKAAVSLGALLGKEVAIRSIVIEGPTVTVVRGSDGTLNLPQREKNFRVPPLPKEATDEKDAPSSWKLAAEKVQLLDGSVHYRDGAYHASAERIVGELAQKPDGFHATVLAASLGRRDETLDLGEARAHGVFRTTELTQLAGAPLAGTFELADAVRGSVNSPSLESRRCEVEVRATLVLGMLRRLLPDGLLPAKFAIEGQAEVNVSASHDPAGGLRVRTLSLQAQDVRARPTPRAVDGSAPNP